MPSPAPVRIDTVGPTSSPRYRRWYVIHTPSGLEHNTTGTSQYAYGALALAIEEGFASRVLAAGFDFPAMSSCELVEIDDDAERADASFGRTA